MIYVFKDGNFIIVDNVKKIVIEILEQFPIKKSSDIISSDKLSDVIGLFSSLIEERIKSRLKDFFPNSNFENLTSSSTIEEICFLIKDDKNIIIDELNQEELLVNNSKDEVLNYLSSNENITVGIDIENIANLPDEIFDIKNKVFRSKIFSEFEIAYSILKPDPELTLLGIFSAKESIIKAIGSRSECDFNDIEINYNNFGNPYPIVKGFDSKLFRLSISHSGNLAISICVLVKNI